MQAQFTCRSCSSSSCSNAEMWISLSLDNIDIIRECKNYLVNIAVLQRAVEENGDGYPIVCICGDAGCAGFFVPAAFSHDDTTVRWALGSEAELFYREPGDSLVFSRHAYRESVERAIEDIAGLLNTISQRVSASEHDRSKHHFWASELSAIESPTWHLKPHSTWRPSKEQTP